MLISFPIAMGYALVFILETRKVVAPHGHRCWHAKLLTTTYIQLEIFRHDRDKMLNDLLIKHVNNDGEDIDNDLLNFKYT